MDSEAWERIRTGWMSVRQEEVVEELMRLQKQLLSPPGDWKPFGSHVDKPGVELEFWGQDADGNPLWERPRGLPVYIKVHGVWRRADEVPEEYVKSLRGMIEFRYPRG